MLEYTKAGDGARLSMLVLHDDAEREYAYGPAQRLPKTKVGTFTQALTVLFPIHRATSGVGFVQQSSKSPQSSSICNHNRPRGDLLDSRFSNNVVSFSPPMKPTL